MTCPKCQSHEVQSVGNRYRCHACGCEWQFAEDAPVHEKTLSIRNSTAEFLIFQAQSQANGVEVLYANETIWCTQKAMAALFDVGIPAISKHLANVFETGELSEEATISKMETVQTEGNRQVKRMVVMYKLDAIIAVGYRVNSLRATQFRQWATAVLHQFAIRGYVLDKKRMENGAFLTVDYFEHLLSEIREIRLSERRLYQKVTDLYATAIDYNKDAPTTRQFFAKVQNKLHYAIHGHTAAELIVSRADANKEHMGLTTWENAPDGKIVKTDVSIAKNYLKSDELDSLGRVVNAFLELAENRAKRHIPMTMEDWAKHIDRFLSMDDYQLLQDNGKVTAEEAKTFAESEFEKYRIVQDRLFMSDFDKELERLLGK
ncbi:MAG: virulence RhuM family protein [Paludibacteraceae bacterium]|nr:virulence RhuM family protein [Paludibacteraceae bacterium]